MHDLFHFYPFSQLGTLLGHLETLLDQLETLLDQLETLLDQLGTLLDQLGTLKDQLVHDVSLRAFGAQAVLVALILCLR